MAASFRVRDHFQITSHGAFAVGEIESGVVRIGDRVVIDPSHTLTITAVEIADHRDTKTSDICLRFKGIEKKSELMQLMPAGSLLTVISAA